MFNKAQVLRAAEKYIQHGNAAAAIAMYEKIIAQDPSDLHIINVLGDLCVRTGKIDQAVGNFLQVAESYRWNGFSLKAIAMFKKILKLKQNNLEALLALSHLHLKQGHKVEARALCQQAVAVSTHAGQWRKAIDAYELLILIDPTDASAHMNLGEICWHERLIERSLDAYLAAGEEFYRRDNMTGALNAYTKAVSISPESREALQQIATIHMKEGQPEQAIRLLADTLEKRPGEIELRALLGEAYLAAEQLGKAEATFLGLARWDGAYIGRLVDVGQKYLELGEVDRAVEQLNQVIGTQTGQENKCDLSVFQQELLDQARDHLDALKKLTDIFSRTGETHHLIAALKMMAEAALSQSHHAKAREALNRLCNLEPYESDHRWRLERLDVQTVSEASAAQVPYRVMQVSAAEVNMTEVLQLTASQVPVTSDNIRRYGSDELLMKQVFLAGVRVRRGQSEQAIAMLKEVLTQAPNHVQARLKLKEIYLRAGKIDLAANESLQLARARLTDQISGGQQDTLLLEQNGKGRAEAERVTIIDLSEIDGRNRRKHERTVMSLPLLITSPEGNWQEFTESRDVNQFGLGLRLMHPIEMGMELRTKLPMPAGLRIRQSGKRLYTASAVIRHISSLPDGANFVGVEFRDIIDD